MASDRNGLSFYSHDAICTLLQLDLDQYITARNALIDQDLIAFDGTVFQVLELPAKPASPAKDNEVCNRQAANSLAIRHLVDQTLKRI